MTIPAELYATACVRTERFAPYVGDERFFLRGAIVMTVIIRSDGQRSDLGRDGDSHHWTWLSV
jgi:hypothetical protein